MKTNKALKALLFLALLFTVALLAVSCGKGNSPYDEHNKNGYTVSVRFDANGGTFDSNVTTIMDTYNLSAYKTNGEGKKEITLFAPNDKIRNDPTQIYTAQKVGYYLAGWYTERTEVKDANGETTYKYGGFWDFKTQKLALDPNKEYDANEPVITLYAAWVPAFTYEFYLLGEDGSTELLKTVELDPTMDTSIKMPGLDPKTGKIGHNNDFPSIGSISYGKIYADAEKAHELSGEHLTHSGTFNKEDATLTNPKMEIYCTTLDGLYFEIDTPDKFTKNAYLNAHYTLTADLDFEGKFWPSTFLTGNFTGSINGNGHSISNVTITQSNNSKPNFGLFGQIMPSAKLENLVFDGITMKIDAGSRVAKPVFGIIAGTISSDATVSGIELKNSKILVSTKQSLDLTNDPSIGFVSGAGSIGGVKFSENNNVEFSTDGTLKYTYEPDEYGRFKLVPVTE